MRTVRFPAEGWPGDKPSSYWNGGPKNWNGGPKSRKSGPKNLS